MGRINVRAKGQRAEREAIHLLQPVVKRVYEEFRFEVPLLERNQMQTNRGGYDIIGLEWMALEIKHQETANRPAEIEKWWAQATRQTKRGQETVLMYKRNNVPWRVRLHSPLGYGRYFCVVDIGLNDFLYHFEMCLRMRLADDTDFITGGGE